jgi:flagellar biosynthesis protein FliP
MWTKRILVAFALPVLALVTGWCSGSLTAAGAAPVTPIAPAAPATPSVTTPTIPEISTPTTTPSSDGSISIDFGETDKNGNKKPGQSVVIILMLTLLAIAPALLVMLTVSVMGPVPAGANALVCRASRRTRS